MTKRCRVLFISVDFSKHKPTSVSLMHNSVDHEMNCLIYIHQYWYFLNLFRAFDFILTIVIQLNKHKYNIRESKYAILLKFNFNLL